MFKTYFIYSAFDSLLKILHHTCSGNRSVRHTYLPPFKKVVFLLSY